MLLGTPLRVIRSAQRLLLRSVSSAENSSSITAKAMSHCEQQTLATQASRTIDFLTLCQSLKVSKVRQCNLTRQQDNTNPEASTTSQTLLRADYQAHWLDKEWYQRPIKHC